jgi:membrane fusion protein (multidrug efflux system)
MDDEIRSEDSDPERSDPGVPGKKNLGEAETAGKAGTKNLPTEVIAPAKSQPQSKILTVVVLLAVAIAGIFIAVKFLSPQLDKGKDEKLAAVSSSVRRRHVKVVPVLSQVLRRIDQFPGEIQAYQDVAIYPKVPGFIKWIGIDRGSIVKKGQDIVGLFAPELNQQRNEANARVAAVEAQLFEARSKLSTARAQVLEARAKLAADDDTYTRTRDASLTPGVVAPNTVVVLREGVAADKEKIKASEDNVKASQDQVKAVQQNESATKRAADSYKDIADYLLIAAPFDGYITERNMHVGSFAGPLGHGAYPPIVRIQQLNLLRIVTPVPEVNSGGIMPGAKVAFTVSTYPGEKFWGTVARLGNYLEQKTRTMPVELNYWNDDRRIVPGMFCEVYWPTRRPKPTLFVPITAVVTESTLSTFVCRVREGKIDWVTVSKGQVMGKLTEVFGDIQAGDIVVVDGTDELQPGTEVEAELVTHESLPLAKPQRPSYPVH